MIRVLALLLLPLGAMATVAAPADVGELAAQSSLIVRARVVLQAVVPERGERGEIYTRSHLEVLGYIKGEGPGELVVQQLGGRLGSLEMRVEGNARLEPGAEVIAFLDADPVRGLTYVVAMAQGLFMVDRRVSPAAVWRDLEGIAFYVNGPRRLREAQDGARSLRSLLDEIQLERADLESAEGGLN